MQNIISLSKLFSIKPATKIGVIGLGNMGHPIAKNISQTFETRAWDIDKNKMSTLFQDGMKYSDNIDQLVQKSNVILLSLPTHKEVNEIVQKINTPKNKGKIIIDCTSSIPSFQEKISKKLEKNNIHLLDAPVSGGPEKAAKGNLACMVGGDKQQYEKVKDVLETFSMPMYVGKIGNGCSIKAINNLLNVSHLCMAAEGIHALTRRGVDINIALEVINQSSGRSLMTEERIPEHILKRNYDYGFTLKLMDKDVDTAMELIESPVMFSKTKELLTKSIEEYGEHADYTNVAKLYFDQKISKKYDFGVHLE